MMKIRKWKEENLVYMLRSSNGIDVLIRKDQKTSKVVYHFLKRIKGKKVEDYDYEFFKNLLFSEGRMKKVMFDNLKSLLKIVKEKKKRNMIMKKKIELLNEDNKTLCDMLNLMKKLNKNYVNTDI